jgi:hypothetical protein
MWRWSVRKRRNLGKSNREKGVFLGRRVKNNCKIKIKQKNINYFIK